MRGLLPVSVVALLCVCCPARADVQSYCQAYARDQANGLLSGSAILGGEAQISQEEWANANSRALQDCVGLYEVKVEPKPAPAPAEVKPVKKPPRPINKKSVTVAASSATLAPGSEAWNDYCDKKYSSFDRKTGTYTSKTGKVRPCLVTRN